MGKLRGLLDRIAQALLRDDTLLKRARKRRKKFARRAKRNHDGALHTEEVADRLRREGHREAAAQKDRKAARRHARAYRSHLKAQWWIGRIKVIQQRIHKLKTREDQLQAEVRELKRGGLTIDVQANTIRGRNARQRLQAAALLSAARCTSGKRRNFYSQPGMWIADRCFTGEPSGYRSDCSQWFASVYQACGLPDPNGTDYTGGYTGTLVSNGRQISASELKPGDAIVYGSGTGFHVEMYVGPGAKTIGHGTAPIDPGVIDLFGDGNYRCFTYDLT